MLGNQIHYLNLTKMTDKENRKQPQILLIFFFLALSDIIHDNVLPYRAPARRRLIIRAMIIIVRVTPREVVHSDTVIS